MVLCAEKAHRKHKMSEEPRFIVDVQHPESGEFTRYFKTIEEANAYADHMATVRGYLAQVRRGSDDAADLETVIRKLKEAARYA